MAIVREPFALKKCPHRNGDVLKKGFRFSANALADSADISARDDGGGLFTDVCTLALLWRACPAVERTLLAAQESSLGIGKPSTLAWPSVAEPTGRIKPNADHSGICQFRHTGTILAKVGNSSNFGGSNRCVRWTVAGIITSRIAVPCVSRSCDRLSRARRRLTRRMARLAASPNADIPNSSTLAQATRIDSTPGRRRATASHLSTCARKPRRTHSPLRLTHLPARRPVASLFQASMAVAFQADFETVQSLAEQMIYKEPTHLPELVEDGEIIDSDNDLLNQKQLKSPLECGFKQTETKPAVFFKMLTDEDIKMREQTRRERRERIAQDVTALAKTKSRPSSFERRRRFHNEIELKERRMREVIFNELSEIWRRGHYLDRPENVHPFIRGDSGELSEESALRRRLFRGCFREFVNDCRNTRKRPHPSQSYPMPPYGHQYQQRIHEHFQQNHESERYRIGERPRSVLESVTWTAEEVRLYYECMAKYNVRPVLPLRHGRVFPMSNVDTAGRPSQPGFGVPFERNREAACRGQRYYEDPYGGQNRRPRDYEPDASPNRMPAYFHRSTSPQTESHSPVASTAASPESQQAILDDVSKVSDDPDDNKGMRSPPKHSNAELLPRNSTTKAAAAKDSATIFVDELLKETADGGPVYSANGESGEIDLYDDL
ncbi:hypothetical protein BIW11_10278 [Tropilaelaps mercedesae]|uniref:Uncharacterized protein n=1 Tax=Tropilaelaps mercedesae TaxID=418985 RepID=A0A1V9XGP7_9ACAR|nr:hypothetical protein BIW11_10278 [Tropilaelaps mercedesae]